MSRTRAEEGEARRSAARPDGQHAGYRRGGACSRRGRLFISIALRVDGGVLPIDARRSPCGYQTEKKRPVRMSGSGKVDELIEASRELYDRKLIHAAGGNTSVRDGDVVRITQTGAELSKLTPEKIVTVDLEGKVLEGSGPSREMDMHLAMYQAKPCRRSSMSSDLCDCLFDADQRRVFQRSATLYGCFLRAGRTVPVIKYHPSGAHSLHEAVAALAPDYHAILLRQHGVIVAGADMSVAIGVVEEVQCCQIAVATGLKGARLTDDQLQAIDDALGAPE